MRGIAPRTGSQRSNVGRGSSELFVFFAHLGQQNRPAGKYRIIEWESWMRYLDVRIGQAAALVHLRQIACLDHPYLDRRWHTVLLVHTEFRSATPLGTCLRESLDGHAQHCASIRRHLMSVSQKHFAEPRLRFSCVGVLALRPEQARMPVNTSWGATPLHGSMQHCISLF